MLAITAIIAILLGPLHASGMPDWQNARSVIPKDAAERLYAPPSCGFLRSSARMALFVRPRQERFLRWIPASLKQQWVLSLIQLDAPDISDGPSTGIRAAPAFPELYWIGQLHGTYIVAQNEEGLFLIDQHAAHERIHYEYYVEKFSRPKPASQQLLVPLTLEYTPAEASALKDAFRLYA